MKLLIMQFSPTSCHFISLQSKYSPQYPVLRHPQSMFLSMLEIKFHTHTEYLHTKFCMPRYNDSLDIIKQKAKYRFHTVFILFYILQNKICLNKNSIFLWTFYHTSLQDPSGLSNTVPAGAIAPVIYFPGALLYSASFSVNQNLKKKIFLNKSMFKFFS
jgi:hypothetical protein